MEEEVAERTDAPPRGALAAWFEEGLRTGRFVAGSNWGSREIAASFRASFPTEPTADLEQVAFGTYQKRPTEPTAELLVSLPPGFADHFGLKGQYQTPVGGHAPD